MHTYVVSCLGQVQSVVALNSFLTATHNTIVMYRFYWQDTALQLDRLSLSQSILGKRVLIILLLEIE